MKKISIILAAIALVLSSCAGFLDVTPTNQAAASSSIMNEADAKVMLNGLYDAMTTSSFYGRNFILYGDAKSGDLTIQSNGRGYDYMFAYSHSVTNYNMSGFWTTGYNMIMLCNNIIENIDRLKEEGTTGLDEYRAQALTIRAMIHYDLCRLYGKSYNDDKSSYGIPIADKTVPAGAQLLRNSVEEVYSVVIRDLDDAAATISKKKNNGFVNYYANRALKARVMMDMQNYSEALSLAEEIIDSGVYMLYSNSQWVASWSSQFGSESIFELGMNVNEGDLGKTGCLGAQYILGGGTGDNNQIYMASKAWLERMAEDPGDIRWGVMGLDQVGEHDGIDRMGSCYKYYGGLDMKGDGKASSSAVNIKLIRLSEIYLIAAEAAVRTNNMSKASNYYNEIHKRSPNLTPVNTVTAEMVLAEKNKELFGEGLRFWDLIRTNATIVMDDTTPDVKVTTRETSFNRSFYKCILPIYNGELNANPGMRAQQNPGY
ncbi:MAG: RagB/SusD family nutrient uptake outer membrane protein [Bacteroidales bacterium]|nr:RagB/SusD family nutrient uptake outer membrane protein [Bacteroidales bacterium]